MLSSHLLKDQLIVPKILLYVTDFDSGHTDINHTEKKTGFISSFSCCTTRPQRSLFPLPSSP